MQSLKALLILCGSAALSACAAFGVVETSDPLGKLNDAEHLYMQQGRPLPAEKLIREAMAIYEERDDAHGLAAANRQYGGLLRSPAVLQYEKFYRENGFQDESITFDNRLEKSLEFYRKAVGFYERAEQEHIQAEKYDLLTNVYINNGVAASRPR